jgi:membrane fusion protein (multidrug efflux system)
MKKLSLLLLILFTSPALANPPKVLAYKVTSAPFSETLRLIGNARSNESVILTAQVTDKVTDIHFIEGSVVKKGDPLLSLEQNAEQSALTAAKTQLRDAKREYERVQKLAKNGITSKTMLDNASSAYAAAQSQLTARQTALQNRTIKAPFAGILGKRDISIGTLLNPNDTITTIDDISIIKVDMDISERYIPFITVKQPFTVTTEAYGNKQFQGVIELVENRIDPVARTFRVRGAITNTEGELRPGMLLVANITTAKENIMTIPEAALIPIAKQKYVFVINPTSHAERRLIKTARRFKDRVEVVEGLTENDIIVTEGQLKLTDGQAVNYAQP